MSVAAFSAGAAHVASQSDGGVYDVPDAESGAGAALAQRHVLRHVVRQHLPGAEVPHALLRQALLSACEYPELRTPVPHWTRCALVNGLLRRRLRRTAQLTRTTYDARIVKQTSTCVTRCVPWNQQTRTILEQRPRIDLRGDGTHDASLDASSARQVPGAIYSRRKRQRALSASTKPTRVMFPP